jgi:hypothetical protein
VWFLGAESAHQPTDCLVCGDGYPNMSLNSCGCPTIPIDKNGGHTIEPPQIHRPVGSIGESNSSESVGYPLKSSSHGGVKGKRVYPGHRLICVGADGRWPEPTRDGFLRATDDALVDVLTGGQRHPRMVQLLPRGLNINKLFIPVQENRNEVECVRGWWMP